MTGIIKTDQLQGAQSSTIAVPSGNNLTVGGTLGIGETTPLGKLHVKSGDSGASSVNANANELVIENSDYTGITILGENESNICFGDNEDPDVGRIEYHHSDNSMRFRTNASDRMHITSAGNVGIGTSSPSSYYAKDLVISSPDEGGITIVQGTGHRGYLAFADGTSGSAQYRGYVSYDHNDDMLYLGTDGGGKLFIDTSGNVLVGTTNANPAEQNVAGIGLLAGNSISVTDDGGAPIQLNRKSSDGSIAIFRRDGSSKGNIGTNGGDLYIAGTTHGLKFDSIDASTMYIRPVNNSGTNLTGQIDLGQAGNVFRDAYVSGGVYFAPNAYPANYLDDYEEGTWTPACQYYEGSPTIANAYYTKIGRQVIFSCQIILDGTGDGSNFRITGLPFTTLNTGSGVFGAFLSYNNGSAIAYSLIGANQSQINNYDSNGTNISYNTAGANKDFRFVGMYITA